MSQTRIVTWLRTQNIEKLKDQLFLVFCTLNIIRSLILVINYDIGFCNKIGEIVTTNRGAVVYYYNLPFYGESCDCADNLGDECKDISFLLILDIILNSLTIVFGSYKLFKGDRLSETLRLVIGSIQLVFSLIIFLMFSRGEVYHFREDQVDDDKTVQLIFLIISYINVMIKLNNKSGREFSSIRLRFFNLFLSITLLSVSISSLILYKVDYCEATNKVLSFKSQIVCHNGSGTVTQIENSWYQGLLLLNLLLSLFDNSLVFYSFLTKKVGLIVEVINPSIMLILLTIVKTTYRFGYVELKQNGSHITGEIIDEPDYKNCLIVISIIKVTSSIFEHLFIFTQSHVEKIDTNIIKLDNSNSITLN